MLKDIDVAQYFIDKDTDNTLFNKDLVTRNNRTFYIGNARLNKYLHIAQMIYIAKTGKPLMDAEFYAYDNGAVTPNVQEKYPILLKQKGSAPKIEGEEKEFLDKFYNAFLSADLDDLIDISHEDYEWIDKNIYYLKSDQKMDLMKHADKYKERFKDIIILFDRMKNY